MIEIDEARLQSGSGRVVNGPFGLFFTFYYVSSSFSVEAGTLLPVLPELHERGRPRIYWIDNQRSKLVSTSDP